MTVRHRRSKTQVACQLLASSCPGLMFCLSGQAAELVNNDSYSLRADTTLQYTLGARTAKPSDVILSNPNFNDGNGAFKRGSLVLNRVDVTSEIDLVFKDKYRSGLRFSANAWYDDVYNRKHQAIPPATYNAVSVGPDEFTRTARRQAGRDIKLFDLFVHSGFDVAGRDLSFRLGRHTLLWGESLFLTGNGIAAGQAPINANKALSVPLTPFKEIALPVNQLSMAYSATDKLNLQAYYQFEYRETDVPAPGTYFSTADLVFQGGERIIAAPGAYFYRGADQRPRKARGQWGLAAKFSDPDSSFDYGAYYVRYSDQTPQIYVTPTGGFDPATGSIGTFNFVYPQNIEIYGLSATTTTKEGTNVGAEVSYRRNAPLVSGGLVALPGSGADGNKNPLYAVGDLLHYQVSTITVMNKSSFWDTATLVGEIGGHTLLKVTKNEAARDTTTTDRTTVGFAGIFEPKYYQLFPNADVSFPISLAYTLTKNQSPVDPAFNGGSKGHGGSFGLGMSVLYNSNVRAKLNWTHYLGADSAVLATYRDRDFLSLSLNYAF